MSHIFTISFICLTAISLAAGAAALKKTEDEPGIDKSWLEVKGELNLDYFATNTDNYLTNIKAKDAHIEFSAKVAKGIKATIAFEITRYLMQNGKIAAGEKFNIEDFVNEAYVEISLDEISGTPIAIVVGKTEMAFGEQLSHLPMYKDNLLFEANREKDVIGLTVALDKKILGTILDSVEASVFENGPGDLRFGKGAGLSIRISKTLSDKIKATVSAAAIERDDRSDSPQWQNLEKRATLGFVYKNGNFSAFAQGILLQGYTALPDSTYGANAGIALNMGPGEMVMEYTLLQKVAEEVALAYNLPIGKHFIISPELRYQFDRAASAPNDLRIGLRIKLKVDNEAEKKN